MNQVGKEEKRMRASLYPTNEMWKQRRYVTLASILDDGTNFDSFSKVPQGKLDNVCLFYPMLVREKLKSELQIVYKRNDFRF